MALKSSQAASTGMAGAPIVAFSDITGVPATGTGLQGAAYVSEGHIGSIGDLEAVIAAQAPNATFTATRLLYGNRKSDTTIAEFLEDDADSIVGDGSLEMGPSGMAFSGFVYIPPGTHTITVRSDDGFDLKRLHGVVVRD